MKVVEVPLAVGQLVRVGGWMPGIFRILELVDGFAHLQALHTFGRVELRGIAVGRLTQSVFSL